MSLLTEKSADYLEEFTGKKRGKKPDSGQNEHLRTIPPNMSTLPHFHQKTEEICTVEEGNGQIVLNGIRQNIQSGDPPIHIKPGTIHYFKNTGLLNLKIRSLKDTWLNDYCAV